MSDRGVEAEGLFFGVQNGRTFGEDIDDLFSQDEVWVEQNVGGFDGMLIDGSFALKEEGIKRGKQGGEGDGDAVHEEPIDQGMDDEKDESSSIAPLHPRDIQQRDTKDEAQIDEGPF